MVVLGVLAWRQDADVRDPRTLYFAPVPSPFRTLSWWLVAAAVAFALTLLAFVFLALRSRIRHVFGRAVSDALLLFAFFASGPLIGAFVESTRSKTGFECLLPGPVLLWAPAFFAAISAIIYGSSCRPRRRPPRADSSVA